MPKRPGPRALSITLRANRVLTTEEHVVRSIQQLCQGQDTWHPTLQSTEQHGDREAAQTAPQEDVVQLDGLTLWTDGNLRSSLGQVHEFSGDYTSAGRFLLLSKLSLIHSHSANVT